MEYKIIEETDVFYIAVGQLPKDKIDQYLVVNKEHGVVEYNNPVLYFCKEWARQMEEALDSFGKQPGFPPPVVPDGKMN